jgi:predicted DNA-binding protein (UPF0251 family)
MILPMHPLAELFPPMSGVEFATLVADIKENGLREPVIVHEGQVLDGRNRYRACLEIGIEPMTRPWDGNGEPLAFVVSKNLHRRHLDEGQRAMVADKIATLKNGANQYSKVGASIDAPTFSQTQAADMMNVSRKSVQRARVVRERGIPELQAAVETGNVSLNAAAAVAYCEPNEQRVIVSQGPAAIVKAAKVAKTVASTGPKLTLVAPVSVPPKAPHGGTIPVPAGATVETQARKALVLETTEGMSPEKAAKQIGIGAQTYRRVRDVILLLDEIELNPGDRESIVNALDAINETKQIAPFDAIAPIAYRVWGDGNIPHTLKAHLKRKDHFATVVGIAVQSISNFDLSEFEVPYLTEAEARRWVLDLEQARRVLDGFIRKLKN